MAPIIDEEQDKTYEAYCIKCKGKKEMKDPERSQFKNGTPVMRGSCIECESTLHVILPRDS